MQIPDQKAWMAWHPRALARHLQGVRQPWCVVGGWALDLWLGHETRAHEDLEFTVLREDLPVFRQRLGHELDFFSAHNGALTALAVDESPPDHVTQIWCWDRAAQQWRVDLMLEAGTPCTWVYKRSSDIVRPRSQAVWHSTDGIPHLNPGVMLLFKAKHLRDKDWQDFEAALPRLPKCERTWLAQQLAHLHPGHAWLGRL